jgi:hypothetical protein
MEHYHNMPKGNEFHGLLRGVMAAHLILLLNVKLVAVIVLLVVLFQGVMAYMLLIFIAGLLVAGGFVCYLSKRLKAQGKSLKDILYSPILSGRCIDISLLGGMASLKIDSRNRRHVPPPSNEAEHASLPEDQKSTRVRTLTGLSKLLDNYPSDSDTNPQAKRKLFN